MKCFRCKEIILKEDKYHIMIEMDGLNKIGEVYVHKVCWDKFIKKVGDVSESMSMIRGLKKFFVKQGVLPEEEYVI